MHCWAVRAEGAESKQVILAEGFFTEVVQKLALVDAHFAEATLVVGTSFRFLSGTDPAFFWLRMAVYTLLLFVAVVILLEKAAHRHLLFYVYVEIVALLAARASILDPVNADKLFPLALVYLVTDGLCHCLHHVD